ncbi:hypothetical protein [Paenibacillus sp. TC-CSREp1]|uniref:hypothetical protein n=1 Tax=Paenibacillus sp. TC-CSREp1 TaxID=3410089 RepID=UPI003D085EEB
MEVRGMDVEKLNVLQPQQVPEYTCLDDRRLVLNSVMHSIIKETAGQKVYIPNGSLTNSYNNKQYRLYTVHTETSNFKCDTKSSRNAINEKLIERDHEKKGITFQQNIWHSRVLQHGSRNQRWFDKLQDYRNGV